MLFSAIDLALPVTKPRFVAAGAQSKHPRRSTFGLAGEARRVGHQVRNFSISVIIFLASIRMSNKCVRRESSSSGELNQAITAIEWISSEGNRAGCKLDIFELGTELKRANTDSLEVFVEDDAFEGGAISEHHLFHDFELIGESDTREGEAFIE